MTLMLGSVRPNDVVLTADGRSTTRTKGVVTKIDDCFQKLFPVPDHPVAIGNLGENHLDGKPIGEFLAGFMRQLNAGNLSLEQISDELRCYAHPAVRRRLKSLNIQDLRCGRWVAGFGGRDEHPRLVENFWHWKGDTLSCDERQFLPTSIVAGGDGQKETHPVDLKAELGKSLEEVRAYHQSLMDEALNAKVDFNSVGGHVHELVITRSEWKWTQPPPEKEVERASTQPATRPAASS
jgi:hypothetical protein